MMFRALFTLITLVVLPCVVTPALDANGASGRLNLQAQNEILAAHNAVRSRLSLPPLVWSSQLAAVVQTWADSLMRNVEFRHSSGASFGENLYMIDGRLSSGTEVVNRWSAEMSNFNWRTNRCRGVCGHYTQIVWRDTKRVGCAVSTSGLKQIWVCEYDPPGNVIGERPY